MYVKGCREEEEDEKKLCSFLSFFFVSCWGENRKDYLGIASILNPQMTYRLWLLVCCMKRLFWNVDKSRASTGGCLRLLAMDSRPNKAVK